MTDQTTELLAVARAMADAAAKETLHWFRNKDLISDDKGVAGFDPVTQADRAAEAAMRAVLADLRPDDAILGEEQADKPGTTGLTWVLDPIDGTRGFMAGTPTWGTLIGVGPDTGPIVGLIDQPYIGERFIAGPDGAMLETRAGAKKPLNVSRTTALSDAVIFSTFPEVGTDAERAGFHDVAGRCKLTRYGMDCYGYALVAGGFADLVIEAGLHSYDIQGPIPVVTAAGGIVTTWSGGNPKDGGQIVAAATPELHAAALDILGAYADD